MRSETSCSVAPMELFGIEDHTNTFTHSSFSSEWRSCAENQNFAAAQVDESKSFPVIWWVCALIGKNLRGIRQSWQRFRETNEHRCSFFFPFYRLFMSCKFLLQKSGSCFNGTGRPRPFVATRFSKTNDRQSHKALAAACCRGCLPAV